MVKNIIKKKGGRVINKHPPSLLNTTGARQPTKQDNLVVKSQNQRLNTFKIGKLSKALKLDPSSFRTRVWKRSDMNNRLQNIFMQFEEIENCRFEPNAGTMNPHAKKEIQETDIVPGEYFKAMGVNFSTSYPKIYK